MNLVDFTEVSKESFDDILNEFDPIANLAEDEDGECLAVCCYSDRSSGQLLGFMRITEDGTEYLVPETDMDTDGISEQELFDILYGA